jgi:hypothetical protein
MRVIRCFFLSMLAAVITSCTSVPHEVDKKRYQRIEIGNDGQGVVRDFKIVYGELTIPHGTNFDQIPAVHRTISSESQVVPVPEIAAR